MTTDTDKLWNKLFQSLDDLDQLYATIGDWIENTSSASTLILYQPDPLNDMPTNESTMAQPRVIRGDVESPDPISIDQIQSNESGIADLSHSLVHFKYNNEWFLALESDEEPDEAITALKPSIAQFLHFAGQFHFNRERADVSKWFLTISQWLMEGKEYEQLLNDMLSLVCGVMDHDTAGFYTLEENEFELSVSRGFDVDNHRDRRVVDRDELIELGMGELDVIFQPADDRDRFHLYLPLRIGAELIGIIALYDLSSGPESLSESQEFSLNSLSTVISIALNNLELNTQLQDKVIHDELSGLKTNEYFRERVHQEIERGQRYGTPSSLLLIDLDRFEEINDEHGIPVGDAVLRELGRIMKNCVRRIDICSRLENDQFGILFPHTSASEALNATERLQEILNTPLLDVHGKDIEVDFSGGLAGFPEDAENVEELFKQVELALYEAKQTGRNQIVTTESVPEEKQTGDSE